MNCRVNKDFMEVGLELEPWEINLAYLRGDDGRIHHLLLDERSVVNKTLDKGLHELCLGDHS